MFFFNSCLLLDTKTKLSLVLLLRVTVFVFREQAYRLSGLKSSQVQTLSTNLFRVDKTWIFNLEY